MTIYFYRIPGVGLDWYIKVSEENFKTLDKLAKEKGYPTINALVSELIENY